MSMLRKGRKPELQLTDFVLKSLSLCQFRVAVPTGFCGLAGACPHEEGTLQAAMDAAAYPFSSVPISSMTMTSGVWFCTPCPSNHVLDRQAALVQQTPKPIRSLSQSAAADHRATARASRTATHANLISGNAYPVHSANTLWWIPSTPPRSPRKRRRRDRYGAAASRALHQLGGGGPVGSSMSYQILVCGHAVLNHSSRSGS